MATSSITKNFIISGNKQAEKFLEALEASEKDNSPRIDVNLSYLHGSNDILEFMKRRKKTSNERK